MRSLGFCGKQVLKDDDALNARGLPPEELVEEMTSLLEGMSHQLEDIVELLKKERHLLGGGDYAALQSLVKDLEKKTIDFLELESKRNSIAQMIADALVCEPKISEIALIMVEEKAAALLEAARKLERSMRILKSEFDITTHLLDESKRFSELLLSQWRELASGGTFSIRG